MPEITLAENIYSSLLNIYNEVNHNDEKLRKFRITAEQLMNNLCKSHARRIHGLGNMAFFLLDYHSAPQKIQENFKGFLALANKAAHENTPGFTDEQVVACIKAVAETTNLFTGVDIPEKIQIIYRGKQLPAFERNFLEGREIIPEIAATIKKVETTDKAGNPVPYKTFVCEGEETGRFTIRIFKPKEGWQPHQQNAATLYDWGSLIPEYTQVYFFDLLQDQERPTFFQIDYTKTRIVLEPDFLMEARDIGSLFQHNGRKPLYYIINKLLPTENTPSILKGSFVNSLLDECIFNDTNNIDEVFEDFVSNNLIVSYFNRDNLQTIKDELQAHHLPTINNNLKRLRGEEGKYLVFTEPTFYSEKYGITGRLDILQKSLDDPLRKNVIELKSGNGAKFGVWKNEEMQVTAYNILLRSTFGTDRTGESSIFYSKAETNPFREVVPQLTKEIEFTCGRNEAFLMLNLLRKNDDRLFEKIASYQDEKLAPFMQRGVTKFQNAYNSATEISKLYYRECVSFLINELFESKISANDTDGADTSFAALWRQNPSIKEDQFFSLIRNLTFESYDEEEDQFIFKRESQKIARFREGDLIILYPYRETLEPLRREILKGSIVEITNKTVTIKLFNKQLDTSIFNQDDYFAIEQDYRDSGILSIVAMMFDFLTAFNDKRELLLGTRKPGSQNISYEKDPLLQASQNENVAKALAASDYYLLQGPPGTGKTSKALMKMVTETLKEPGRTVTILAFTNKAIKDVNKKLAEAGIEYLFVSSNSDDDNALRSLVKIHNLESFGEYVKQLRVITATVAAFIKNNREIRHFFNFDLLIVDEASQLLEPQLAGVLVNFNKFVLIGDQNQLPAVTVQSGPGTEVKNDELKALGITDLKGSLFERLFKNAVEKGWNDAYGTLTEQFRMDSDILKLINHYYHGRLNNATRGRRSLSELYTEKIDSPLWEVLANNRVIFIETVLSDSGKKNEREAENVQTLVEIIRKSGLNKSEDIGVITPWRAQIAAIRQKLEEIGAEDLVVDTVERFQGSENNIIIYSTAASKAYEVDKMGSIGVNKSTLGDMEVDRKLNVVLSRAREQIIILGTPAVLKYSNHYRNLLEMVRNDGLFISTQDRIKLFGT